eukprot:6124622-Pleurochrysis_carterae.AAC.1
MGERLGRFIIKFLPAVLAGAGRALLRELKDKKVSGNKSRVIEKTMRLVKMAHTPVSVSAVNTHQGKEGKRAVVAAAFSRKGDSADGAPQGRPPCELPNGQWCSKGTCHFTHDKVNPGGACYRDPRWRGPLPETVLNNKQQEERSNNARENIAHHAWSQCLPQS